jgi:hypothetical protein
VEKALNLLRRVFLCSECAQTMEIQFRSCFLLCVHVDELPSRSALIAQHCQQLDANTQKLEAYAAATGNALVKKAAS